MFAWLSLALRHTYQSCRINTRALSLLLFLHLLLLSTTTSSSPEVIPNTDDVIEEPREPGEDTQCPPPSATVTRQLIFFQGCNRNGISISRLISGNNSSRICWSYHACTVGSLHWRLNDNTSATFCGPPCTCPKQSSGNFGQECSWYAGRSTGVVVEDYEEDIEDYRPPEVCSFKRPPLGSSTGSRCDPEPRLGWFNQIELNSGGTRTVQSLEPIRKRVLYAVDDFRCFDLYGNHIDRPTIDILYKNAERVTGTDLFCRYHDCSPAQDAAAFCYYGQEPTFYTGAAGRQKLVRSWGFNTRPFFPYPPRSNYSIVHYVEDAYCRPLSSVVSFKFNLPKFACDANDDDCFVDLALATARDECLLLGNKNRNFLGALYVSIKRITYECEDQKVIYYTRNHKFKTQSRFVCESEEGCAEDTCPNGVLPEDRPDLFDHPSYTGSHDTVLPSHTYCIYTAAPQNTSTSSCSCANCTGSCLYYRITAVPTDWEYYPVYRCTKWIAKLTLNITLQTGPGQNESTDMVIREGSVLPFFWHGLDFFIPKVSLPVPDLHSALFLGSEMHIPTPAYLRSPFVLADDAPPAGDYAPGTVGQLQCQRVVGETGFRCGFSPEACSCTPRQANSTAVPVSVDCVCPSGDLYTRFLTAQPPDMDLNMRSVSWMNSKIQIPLRIRGYVLPIGEDPAGSSFSTGPGRLLSSVIFVLLLTVF